MNQKPNNTDNIPSPQLRLGWRNLVLIALLALAVRSYGLIGQSFSNDEVIDLEIARLSWSEIVFLGDGFPPLHHLIFKVSLLLSGSDMAGRWVSVVYGVLAVPIVGLLAQRIAGSRCGLIAAGLLAISPMHVYFSQEGRSYALFFLVTALATWLFWRALETCSRRDWVIFSLVASIGGYAHYYFCFVLLGFALIWLKKAWVSGDWRPGLLAFVGIGVLNLPLLALVAPDIGCQQSVRQGDFNIAAVAYTGWALLMGFCLGPSLRELHGMNASSAIQAILPWMLPAGIVSGGLLLSLLRRSFHYRWELLTLLIIPIGCACVTAAGFSISHYNVRYVLPSLLPLVVIMAAAIATSKNKAIAVVLGLLLVTIGFSSIFSRHHIANYQNEDSRAACEYLAANAVEPLRVFTIAHYMENSARYYLPNEYEVIPLADVTLETQSLKGAINLINQKEGPYWVFYSRGFHGDPEGAFKEMLLQDTRVTHEGSWVGVELFRGVSPISDRPEQPIR